MQEMGYAKVSMTQRYARFEINELSYDFPTLIEASNKPKFDAVDTISMDTERPPDAKFNNIVIYG